MIKSVIFDLGRVIVPFDFHRIYVAFEALTGQPAARFREARPTDLANQFEQGRISSEEFADEYCRRMNVSLPYDRFCDIWCSIFFPETLVPEELLRNLAGNYCLVLLSNTNRIHFEMIRKTYPLLRHFHHLVLSYEVGELKPSPVIYGRAVQAARCRPDECFFTDDVVEYVHGARQFGIDAVQFESAAQIIGELQQRGVRTN